MTSQDWSDKKKWWMGLVQTIISTIITTLVTIGIITFIVNRNMFKWQINYSNKTEILRNYDNACTQYWLTGYDAIGAASMGKNRDSSDDIKQWQDKSTDDLIAANDNIREWFDVDSIRDSSGNAILMDMETRRSHLKFLFDGLKSKQTIQQWDSLKKDLMLFGENYLSEKRKAISLFRKKLEDE